MWCKHAGQRPSHHMEAQTQQALRTTRDSRQHGRNLVDDAVHTLIDVVEAGLTALAGESAVHQSETKHAGRNATSYEKKSASDCGAGAAAAATVAAQQQRRGQQHAERGLQQTAACRMKNAAAAIPVRAPPPSKSLCRCLWGVTCAHAPQILPLKLLQVVQLIAVHADILELLQCLCGGRPWRRRVRQAVRETSGKAVVGRAGRQGR